MDILYLLDRLDEVVASAARVPFSSRVLVDEQEYLDVVDQIRLALPEELKLARRVMADRDQILTEAGEQANRLVERAEDQAASRVDEHALVQAAERRARSLVDQAQLDADELRRQADAYAHQLLISIHQRLRQLTGVVQQGLAELQTDRLETED